jgi:fucose permease
LRRIFLTAILTGMASTMLGPLMPGFQARWKLDDAHGGLLFAAQFIAQVSTALVVGYLARRIGYWRLTALGLLVVAAGVVGCASLSWSVALLSVMVYGCGLGLAVPASNLGIAAASGEGDSARQVVYLNLFWSVGAVSAPALVATLREWFLPALAIAAVLMAVVIVLGGAGHKPTPAAATGLGSVGIRHVALAAVLFLYVGAETSVAGWVSSYATRSASARQFWAVLPAVFWGSILFGRGVAPSVLKKIRPANFMPTTLLCALAGSLVLVAGDGPVALLAGSAVTGFGFAPVFPVVVAVYADLTAGANLSGFIFSAAGLGGASIPWLVGVISTVFGSLRTGLFTVLALILAILWLIRTAMPRSDRSS